MNANKLISVMLFFMILNVFANEKDEIQMNVLTDKPYFTIEIDSTNAYYEYRLNGINLLYSSDEARMKVSLPVNHWMKPGMNQLEVLVAPLGSETEIRESAEIKMTLKVRSLDDADVLEKTVVKLSFSKKMDRAGIASVNSTSEGKYNSARDFFQDENGDIEVFKVAESVDKDISGSRIYSVVVNIPMHFPKWKVFESEDIADIWSLDDEEYYKLRDSLYREYEKVQNALERKDIATILDLASERNEEIDRAFYHPAGTNRSKLQRSITQILNDQNAELVELKPTYVGLSQSPNKKLLRGERSGGGSVIGFDFTDSVGSQSYDMIFRRENGKWILTR